MSRGRSQYGRTGDAKLLPFSPPPAPKYDGISLSKCSVCADTHAETEYVSKSRREQGKMKQGVEVWTKEVSRVNNSAGLWN